ncbi:hypothetical protein AB1L30_05535 [Bremerella sp. JC817]|uniref:hypothetical protein n=1 Tax=Bremerella sp. JC817 TaxID=3231756 RepID=UPI003459D865
MLISSKGRSAMATIGLFLLTSMISAQEIEGEITEVKGSFFKITTTENALVPVGHKGVVELVTNSQSTEVPFVVSAVSGDYIVGKANSFQAEVGQKVRLQPVPFDFVQLVGKQMDVKLSTGREMAGLTLNELVTNEDGSTAALLVELPEGGGATRLSFSTIQSVSYRGRQVYLADIEDVATRPSRSMASNARPNADRPRTRKEILEARAQEKEAAEQAKYEQWLTQAKKNGVVIWPEFTEKERTDADQAEKDIAQEVGAAVAPLEVYETKYFIVFSNGNPADIKSVVAHLDSLHLLVSKMYQVDPDKVYKGKMPIYIFRMQQQFQHYLSRFLETNAEGLSGLCSYSGDRIIVATYITSNAIDFADTLLQLASLAEVRAYKSKSLIRPWFTEGLADYVSIRLLPQAEGPAARRKLFMTNLPQMRSLNGMLLKDNDLSVTERGASSLLIEFLVRTDATKFVDLLDNMKAGLEFEEALQKSYDGTSQALIGAFGQSIGAPQLLP